MHRTRRIKLALLLAPLAAISLLAGACSSSPASGSSGGSKSSGDTARETAETRLEAIGPKLATVLVDYRAGKKQQAYNLAKSVSSNLYEGTTEGIVSGIDPAGERQIDPLLAATLPAAIQSGESTTQVAALIHRAQALATSCLNTIHGSEAHTS